MCIAVVTEMVRVREPGTGGALGLRRGGLLSVEKCQCWSCVCVSRSAVQEDSPSNDVRTLPVTADSIFCARLTPMSPTSAMSSALLVAIPPDVPATAKGAVYLEWVRGVSSESQRREQEDVRMVPERIAATKASCRAAAAADDGS